MNVGNVLYLDCIFIAYIMRLGVSCASEDAKAMSRTFGPFTIESFEDRVTDGCPPGKKYIEN